MTIRTVLRVAGLSTAFGLAVTLPAMSQGLQKAQSIGGAGGNPFEYICAPGRALVGLRGFTGVWIDNVQAVCGRVDGNTISDVQPEGPVFGGSRPLDKSVKCADGSAIRGVVIELNKDKPFLGRITVRCGDLSAGNLLADAPVMRGTGLLESDPDRAIGSNFSIVPPPYDCPSGTFAVGIHGKAGQFLDALGLICGPRPMPPDSRTASVAFHSVNYPDRYIRHRQWLAYIEPRTDELAMKDAGFKVIPGLGGRCSSFESLNNPGHFLRHEGTRIKLARRTGDLLFHEDATFCLVPGLAGSGSSFESVNYPQHYIRHSHNELWLRRFDGTDLFRKDATFVMASADSPAWRRSIGRGRLDDFRPTERETATRPPALPPPPFIIANPVVVTIAAGQTQGKTTLTWDGGPGHQYAEVWVKVDSADATYVLEQGKGSREMTVERGKTYLFILTDTGRELATVRVTAR